MFKGFRGVCLCVLLGLIFSPEQSVSSSEPMRFKAAMDKSEWREHRHLLHCELEHPIPLYGVAKFHQEAGKSLALDISVKGERIQPKSEGVVSLVNPIWRKVVRPESWSMMSPDGKAWHLDALQAHRLLEALSVGKEVVLSHTLPNIGQALQAVLSPVKFRYAYEGYLDCLTRLVPVTFEKISTTLIFFDTASVRLKLDDKVLLGYVAAYAAEPDIRKIEITGYTDTIGSFESNRTLSKKRAEAVKQFLLDNGVQSEHIVEVLGGENGALASNKTKEGRAKNRHVKVRLFH